RLDAGAVVQLDEGRERVHRLRPGPVEGRRLLHDEVEDLLALLPRAVHAWPVEAHVPGVCRRAIRGLGVLAHLVERSPPLFGDARNRVMAARGVPIVIQRGVPAALVVLVAVSARRVALEALAAVLVTVLRALGERAVLGPAAFAFA